MSAPVITFYTSSATITGNAPPTSVFDMTKLGAMGNVYNFGTIDTGSSGSNTWFWIFNNIAGATTIEDAVLSSSTANQLGLGHHESGSTSHASESSYTWSLQSGSLTGSVWVTGSYLLLTGAGSVYVSGAASSGGVGSSQSSTWAYIYSGSSGARLVFPNYGILSGSTTQGGNSGSAWLIGCYISILNSTPLGTKTGSFCVKYTYT